MTERIAEIKREYIDTRPAISVQRAKIFTDSHKATEGEPVIIRRVKAFLEVCRQIPVKIFSGELIVGNIGEFRRSGIVCPEYSWRWVNEEMDNFTERTQDQYEISELDKFVLRKEIFPYWQGKSLEETFLARLDAKTANVLVDTGIVDNDSKWRSAVGEITAENIEKIEFYRAEIIVCEGIITLVGRYAEEARLLASTCRDSKRKAELLRIAEICTRVPENPPQNFREALQTVWFTQLGSILSENSLALNLGRFDQYMYPYYQKDAENNELTRADALELIEALWLKLSEWVWAISSNTAQFFAGYNSFQNLTIGGRKRDGSDATNELSYLCLEATEKVKTHQPGLSVRIHADCPPEFLLAVCKLIKCGTGFPAVHNDRVGSDMLLAAGLSPEDARDWSNCGCVVPHFRKIGEWTSAVNINLVAAVEFTFNKGIHRQTGKQMGLVSDLTAVTSFAEFKELFYEQLASLVQAGVTGSLVCQRIHAEIVPRPYLSLLVDGCMEKGRDLSKGGAQYCLGPVLTGIGLADAANALAAVKKLVFEEKRYTLAEIQTALAADWHNCEEMRREALACPKYGNDNDYVDSIAREISDRYHALIHQYFDLFGARFNSAFMGISNYIPAGSVVGATPEGRKAGSPLTEGVSPHAGTDVSSPVAALKSAAKLNHDVHSGGTLVNIKLSPELLKTERGLGNLAAMIRGYFALGAFHVQFNVISEETLRAAQATPEEYKDLLVRVAGYSTQFVNLSKKAQDAIIERTTYASL